MAAIASENVKLESAIEIGKRTKQKLDQQIRGIEQQCGNSQVLQNQLADLAAPELLDRQFVLQEQMKFIQLRLANAQEYVAKNADRLRRAEQEHNSANQRVYARRLRQWRADATDASESLATCHRELAELRAKMLSE